MYSPSFFANLYVEDEMIDKVYLTKREIWARFKDKFAHNPDTGVRKLTADGCAHKFDLTREEMHLSDKENKIRNWEHRNNAEWEEQRLVRKAHHYFQMGMKLMDNEGLEGFVNRCDEDTEASCIHDCDNCLTPIC